MLKAALKDAIRANLTGDASRVETLDDEGRRFIRYAPNAIEWCTGPDWLDSPSLFEFQRSYQLIRDYFQLRCPMCNIGGVELGQPGDCWRKSRAYLEAEVLLVWDNDNLEDTCPKCGNTRSQLVEDGMLRTYTQFHLLGGMRSGKSMCGAMMGTYMEHFLLVTAHTYPGGFHGYLGITPAEKFELTFLAANQVQSQDTIWAKFIGFRSQSPWFRRYVPWIKNRGRDQVTYGMRPWKYQENMTEIENEHPHVRTAIVSLNSNSAGQAGRTRIGGFVDELARMNQTESRLSAEEVYRTIENSLQTVRSRVLLYGAAPWLGSMISVTSTIARNDKAMRLWRQSDRLPRMYSRKFATWDFNPKEPRSHFDDAFAKDPVGTMRDFGAEPPGAEHPLVHDEKTWLENVLSKDLAPRATFAYPLRTGTLGHPYITVQVKTIDRLFDRNMPRFIVFDAGKNFNAFAGCCAHGEWIERDADTDDDADDFVTVVDWIMRAQPPPGHEVFFDSVVGIMKSVKKMQLTNFVAFDRWNSVQLIQQIRELGIPAEAETLKNQDFVNWKIDCFGGKFFMPPPALGELATDAEGAIIFPLGFRVDPNVMSETTCAIYELSELQCDPDTHEVSNPHKDEERGISSDDAARVVVHAHKLVQTYGVSKLYDDRSRRIKRQRAERSGMRATVGRVFHPRATAGVPPKRPR